MSRTVRRPVSNAVPLPANKDAVRWAAIAPYETRQRNQQVRSVIAPRSLLGEGALDSLRLILSKQRDVSAALYLGRNAIASRLFIGDQIWRVAP